MEIAAMKKSALLSALVSVGMAQFALAQQGASFEDAVRMAAGGLIARGTVVSSNTEGKEVPLPRLEAGKPPLLHTTWRVRIEDCYFRAGGRCRDEVGKTIDLAAVTGVAIEREDGFVSEDLITNSGTLAVTAPLERGRTFLLLLRPYSGRPGTYQIVAIQGSSGASDEIATEGLASLVERIRGPESDPHGQESP